MAKFESFETQTRIRPRSRSKEHGTAVLELGDSESDIKADAFLPSESSVKDQARKVTSARAKVSELITNRGVHFEKTPVVAPSVEEARNAETAIIDKNKLETRTRERLAPKFEKKAEDEVPPEPEAEHQSQSAEPPINLHKAITAELVAASDLSPSQIQEQRAAAEKTVRRQLRFEQKQAIAEQNAAQREERRALALQALEAIDHDPIYQMDHHARVKALARMVRKACAELGFSEEAAKTFGSRWMPLGFLAEGGMGAVFEAEDLHLRKPAVLKFIRNHAADGTPTDVSLQRFKREAKSMARLDSPNVVRVYDAYTSKENSWFAMEKIEGIDIADRLDEKGAFTVADAVNMLGQVARGIKDAADVGVVHRDLKPANILYREQDGRYKLADFGLAKSVQLHSIKMRWLTDLARELLEGQATPVTLGLDKKSSDRLKRIVADIQMDSRAAQALKTSEDELALVDPEAFDSLKQLAQDIPDQKVEPGYNKILDSYKKERLAWVAEQVLRLNRGQKVSNYHDQAVSEGVLALLQKLATELARQPDITRSVLAGDDLSLENLAFEIDFEAIASALPEANPRLTEAGLVLGTPAYMSPEQCRGEEVTTKTDVWSLGVIMYEVLTTEMPFKGGGFGELAQEILQKEPDPVRHLRKDVPARLNNLITKMLSKEASERPSLEQIIAVAESFEGEVLPSPVTPRLKKMAAPDMPTVIQEKKPGFFGRLFGKK